MYYLKHITTGRTGKFSDGTIKALRGIPDGWVEIEEPKMNIKTLPPPEPKPIPATLEEAEADFEMALALLEQQSEPTRDEMIDELRAAGVGVHPRIGKVKLKERYENYKQENG